MTKREAQQFLTEWLIRFGTAPIDSSTLKLSGLSLNAPHIHAWLYAHGYLDTTIGYRHVSNHYYLTQKGLDWLASVD
jgi:hypothetical protein